MGSENSPDANATAQLAELFRFMSIHFGHSRSLLKFERRCCMKISGLWSACVIRYQIPSKGHPMPLENSQVISPQHHRVELRRENVHHKH
jgi:hypothetical protein